jgi:hypothetical protein
MVSMVVLQVQHMCTVLGSWWPMVSTVVSVPHVGHGVGAVGFVVSFVTLTEVSEVGRGLRWSATVSSCELRAVVAR